jgi:NhaP-type Na+/H+ or K+/H+ antiporter
MSPALQTLVVAISGGVAAQWIARVIRMPAILPLLALGVLLGPQGSLPIIPRPSVALPITLHAIITLGVVVILFEGGLLLNLHDLRLAPRAVRGLITIGAAVSLAGASAAAYLILEMGWRESLLFGALMIVTGPTVIGPLLKNVKVLPRVHTVLLWEGILIDAIGALTAVILLELLFESGGAFGSTSVLLGGVIIGPLIGLAFGWVLARWLAWRMATGRSEEELDHILALGGALAVFGASEAIVKDSGLGAVIVAGMVVAQVLKGAARKLREFKGTLTTIAVSTLFMLLAADFDLRDLQAVWPRGAYVLAVIMLVVRPVNVALATGDSLLSWKEKLFLAWIAPRGIVAASVATLMAQTLAQHGHVAAGRQLVALTFLVIAGTVVLNGLTARPLAWLLRLRATEPKGLLIAGAHPFGIQVAAFFEEQGFPVMLVDTNPENCAAARQRGFRTVEGSILDYEALAAHEMGGIGRLFALTSNTAVNAQACLRTAQYLGLAPYHILVASTPARDSRMLTAARSRALFADEVDLFLLNAAVESGRTRVVEVAIPRGKTPAIKHDALPLAVASSDGLRPFALGPLRTTDTAILCLELGTASATPLPFKPAALDLAAAQPGPRQ